MGSLKRYINLKWAYLWLALGSIFVPLPFIYLSFKGVIPERAYQHLQLLLLFFGLAFIAFRYFKKKPLTYRQWAFIIITFGFILRLCYVLYTKGTSRQHDFMGEHGHLHYMVDIADTGALPLTNDYQYYHPPLVHLLGAPLVWLCLTLNLNKNLIIELLQVLPLLFSSLTMLAFYRIIKRLHLSERVRIAVLALAILHPFNLILCGMINNDCLMWLFFIHAILYLMIWYEKATMKNTAILALCVGLGMMSKLSAGFIAPACIFIFACKLIPAIKAKNGLEIKAIVKKGLCFSGISIPIGLWYPIRNYILFNQSFNYVPHFNTGIRYHGDVPILQRFALDFRNLFPYVFQSFEDTNDWVTFLKTSLFDEQMYQEINTSAIILTVLNLILITASLFSIAYVLLKDRKASKRLFYIVLAGIWALLFVSHVIFMVQYPNLSTPSYRYSYPTAFIGAVFIGRAAQLLSGKKAKNLPTQAFCVLTVLFVVFTVFAYSSKSFLI
ncbi:MAG: glycosyltransferase family 39 protein [Oscillospiraceae bacterium]|nr:glycosyltransferase family 39 protein [Oscillospiraceae bacterium]